MAAGSATPAGSSSTSVDDHSRLAYAEVLADEKGSTAVCFLRRALKFFAGHGVTSSG